MSSDAGYAMPGATDPGSHGCHGLVERVVAGGFRAGSGLVWVATQLGQAVLERGGKIT